MALACLLLAGCSDHRSHLTPTYVDITDKPQQSDGNVDGVLIDTCSSVSGWTQVGGQFTGDGPGTRSYRVYVQISHDEHLLAIRQVQVLDVEPFASTPWEEILPVGMLGATCSVLAAEPVAIP